jgi:mannose-6-phosphate isomerase class I
MDYRKTTQSLMPVQRSPGPAGEYDIYPAFALGAGKIFSGFEALAERISHHQRVLIDGFAGVLWADFREQLDAALLARGVQATWICVDVALRRPFEIKRMVESYLGEDDPIFGTRFSGSLSSFFDKVRLDALCASPEFGLHIVYGCGAALADKEGLLVYLDLPKNELQFRARAGIPTNLGWNSDSDAKMAYKRSYFVDWPVLNAHKASLHKHIDLIVDAQRPNEPVFMTGDDLRSGLASMARNYFRVRPWFEPGPWGGQWIKRHIPELPQDVPNYAWSFELITPENGLVVESGGNLLEISFDWLMIYDSRAVLGDAAKRFGMEFPIRFDFLDTVDGGNLSIQCHPRPEYARQNFGENFTQDETYYILDCVADAKVYLGFQEGINPNEFRAALEHSFNSATPVEIDTFVQSHPAAPHDLFLIPNGTIHGAGQGNLVLEISSTPYIFTFKMYDWLRPDLEGKPRPLNIKRAFENLYFDRKKEELISKPHTLSEGPGWRIVHLPTHSEHFYDVHRLEFDTSIEVDTQGQCHVLSLVEGSSIVLETAEGIQQRFNYAETFVVPAAARHYRLTNESGSTARVVKAFVKPDAI